MDTETKALVDWLLENITKLRNGGSEWQIVLHGNTDGNIKHEVKTTGKLMLSKKINNLLEE